MYTPGCIGKNIWWGIHHTQRALWWWCGEGEYCKSLQWWHLSPFFDVKDLVCQASPWHIHCMVDTSCETCIPWSTYFSLTLLIQCSSVKNSNSNIRLIIIFINNIGFIEKTKKQVKAGHRSNIIARDDPFGKLFKNIYELYQKLVELLWDVTKFGLLDVQVSFLHNIFSCEWNNIRWKMFKHLYTTIVDDVSNFNFIVSFHYVIIN